MAQISNFGLWVVQVTAKFCEKRMRRERKRKERRRKGEGKEGKSQCACALH